MPDSSFVLVTGATGKQGGAVTRALLAAGRPVHALVRREGERTAPLAELGAVIVHGDLDDQASLKEALVGARAVFSVQAPDFTDPLGDSEIRRGRNLVEAARSAEVEHIVHTSVAGAGTVDVEHFDEARWGAFVRHYYRSKAVVEDIVRSAGISNWTILRPATFMENFVRPSPYFADMTSDRLFVAVDPDVPLPFVTVRDVGTAAAAALAHPRRFHGTELELAGDVLTFRDIGEILTSVLATDIALPARSPEVRPDDPLYGFVQAQRHMSAHPAPAHPGLAADLGITTTTFAKWAEGALRGPSDPKRQEPGW